MGRGAGGDGGAAADRAFDGAGGALAAWDAKPDTQYYGVGGVYGAFDTVQSLCDEARSIEGGCRAGFAAGRFAAHAPAGAGFHPAGAALDAARRTLLGGWHAGLAKPGNDA